MRDNGAKWGCSRKVALINQRGDSRQAKYKREFSDFDFKNDRKLTVTQRHTLEKQ
jgi:hypothetical protein